TTERLPPQVLAVLAGAVPTRRVGAAGVLDLDHLRAEVAEMHRGQRTGEQRGQVDHAQIVEGAHPLSSQHTRNPIDGEASIPSPGSRYFALNSGGFTPPSKY